MDNHAAQHHRPGEHGTDEAPSLRRKLQEALAAKGRAEARVAELESELQQAHDKVAAERTRANRIANRRIVRAALATARTVRPVFRLVRWVRRRRQPPVSPAKSRADDAQSERATGGIDAAVLIPALGSKPTTTVLVPVHDALDDVRRCMESLLRNTPATTPILVIDDASRDPGVAPYLDSLGNLANVQVLRNKENAGFVRTANRGFAETTGDIVLLNSDTVVPPRWLENLTIAVYQSPGIGTASPLSDNAGAFSVPIPGSANSTPAHLGPDDLGRLITQTSLRRYPGTPTGHGFCMYLRRAMLDEVGGFDEEAFPRGYGEENDLCMRARGMGWRHVVDDATLVLHAEGASFGTAGREARTKAARQVVIERHPAYLGLVKDFLASPDMEAVRANAAAAFRAAEAERSHPRPRVLYVLHEGDGGTPESNRDLMSAVEADLEPWLLTSTSRRLLLYRVSDGDTHLVEGFDIGRQLTTSDTTNPQYRDFVTRVLVTFGIELVHVRHLIKHTLDLPEIAAALGIPVVLSFHDFYFVCPTVHLLDNDGRWCAGTCTPGDGVCPAPRPDPSIHLKHSWVYTWQDHVRRMFRHVDAFVTTTPFTRDLYCSVYPELTDRFFTVIEHGRDLEQHHGLSDVPTPGGPIRIAIVGNLAPHKGSDLIRRIKAADHSGRIEFHFLGRTNDRHRGIGVAHGTYEREELPDRLAEIRPHFVGLFSTSGETYSHTLTEAWACGIPVIATQLGALGERVSARGGGWLVDHEDPDAAVATIYDAADDTTSYERRAGHATIAGVPSTSAMAEEYVDLYGSTRTGLAARGQVPV